MTTTVIVVPDVCVVLLLSGQAMGKQRVSQLTEALVWRQCVTDAISRRVHRVVSCFHHHTACTVACRLPVRRVCCRRVAK